MVIAAEPDFDLVASFTVVGGGPVLCRVIWVVDTTVSVSCGKTRHMSGEF